MRFCMPGGCGVPSFSAGTHNSFFFFWRDEVQSLGRLMICFPLPSSPSRLHIVMLVYAAGSPQAIRTRRGCSCSTVCGRGGTRKTKEKGVNWSIIRFRSLPSKEACFCRTF